MILVANNLDLLRNEFIALLAVASNLGLGEFFPFLEEFNVVLLGFLLNQTVVFVHLSHKLDMTLMHLFHVFFDLEDVLLCKLDWYKATTRTVKFGLLPPRNEVRFELRVLEIF